MDPQSAAFTPQNDLWRVQADLLHLQQTQVEHSERLERLERRQDNDARMKSVWGTSSPFPSILSGTPQQGPVQQPPADAFSNFDDQHTNLINSLHLDADEEPRRIGATSRANSVRFDESANQGHWAHTSRSSVDLIPRTGSGLGGHPMSERTYSHKSDGRQSSAGHSVHSLTSGRANSLGLDTNYGLSHSNNSPVEPPSLAPGQLILGPVPSIIRCWLDNNFKHSSLLYAAVCTGSCVSYIDLHLVVRLGFQNRIYQQGDGSRKVQLTMYLPEAIPQPSSSRSNSAAPQLPSVSVSLTVIDRDESDSGSKEIQVFLGSDMLRGHNADILFSSNRLTLFDDEGSKLSVPFVIPEDERVFKTLHLSNTDLLQDSVPKGPIAPSGSSISQGSTDASEKGTSSTERVSAPNTTQESNFVPPTTRPALEQRPSLGLLNTRPDPKETDSPRTGTPSRSGSAIWGNWRRDSDAKPSSQMDWAAISKGGAPTYQRRESGIKVLRPLKAPSRTVTSTEPAKQPAAASSPSLTGQSRFFDEGRRRSGAGLGEEGGKGEPIGMAKASILREREKEKDLNVPKTRDANPVGGASAFSWLKSSGSK
ncbi:hypothetical protein M501DRAFT_939108 [Patellaria atrata CBS 101060]|uniref:Ubiquitin carboxyl-terminal hydrolase 19 n=1 Tax=Patellaria atrata CBS 101060 TaxID=1346257 RepID=A0A9P4S847_9PEZI|nr:hypothetical protein M501DRAFT_939108 [Patellaria atrata CBS 101060]